MNKSLSTNHEQFHMRTLGSEALQAYGHLCDTFALSDGVLFSAACTLRHPNPVFTFARRTNTIGAEHRPDDWVQVHCSCEVVSVDVVVVVAALCSSLRAVSRDFAF